MTGEPAGKSDRIDRTGHYSALAAGVMIDRYRVVSVLGQGGFGITYRCRDTQLHRDVAVKEYLPAALAVRQDDRAVLPRSTEVSKDFVWGRGRFLDEVRAMALLGDAPAVVRVYDFLEAHGTAYVVMQLLEGETLERRLQREERLSQAMIERILQPMLAGLDRIHSVGCLHRDIKPANIMLAPDGSPTLIDFGASRMAVAGRSPAMTAVFTPGYAAPEQSTSGRQGPWTDVYGLAATLYTCVNGTPPPGVMDRVFEGVPVSSLETTGEDYSPGLLAAIEAGLVLRAEARPRSIDAWRKVLATGLWAAPVEALPDAVPIAAPVSTSAPAPAPKPSRPIVPGLPRRRQPAALAVAASIAVVALAGIAIALVAPGVPAERAGRDVVTAKLNEVAAQQAVVEAAARDAQLQEQLAARAIEEARRDGEQAESNLGLSRRDRQKLQVALAAAGFDVGGADGAFGPRSREAIADWQRRRGDIATGFLTATQKAALVEENVAAIDRWDAAQRLAYVRYEEARWRARIEAEERLHRQQATISPPRTGWRWPWQ
jgi:serine/threonine protein kinase